MSLAVQAPAPTTAMKDESTSRVLLREISWAVYEQLREDESNWGVRMSFDGGDLELISPSQKHEEIGYRFELFVVALAQALDFEFAAMVHTTWKNAASEKAKEADASYYITNFEKVRGKTIDLDVDPPPDLAVEVEVSRSAIDSLSIYAAIGVPEVWRFDGDVLRVHLRQADGERDRRLISRERSKPCAALRPTRRGGFLVAESLRD